LDVTTSHNRETLLFLLISRPFMLVARVGKGARDHIYQWIKGYMSPVDTLGAGGPKIGRHYQPQHGNFVVSVNFTTFHACCSGGERRPRSHLSVDQGLYVTSEHFGSRRAEDWTSLPATKGKLCLFLLLSRPFTLVARVGEGAQDHS
jgi:hypothetical protein